MGGEGDEWETWRVREGESGRGEQGAERLLVSLSPLAPSRRGYVTTTLPSGLGAASPPSFPATMRIFTVCPAVKFFRIASRYLKLPLFCHSVSTATMNV